MAKDKEYYKAYYKEWCKKNKEKIKAYSREYYRKNGRPGKPVDPIHKKNNIKKYPEKKAANSALTRSGNLMKGMEGHHWSYKKESWFDVIWLNKKDHMKAHRFLYYDQQYMMYRRSDNFNLLDSRHDHLRYISDCIQFEKD